MASAGWLLRKLVSVLLGLLSVIKSVYQRVVCRSRRSRRMSGSVLPFTDQTAVNMAAVSSIQQSVPANEVEFERWDAPWGTTLDASGDTLPQRQSSQEPEGEDNFFGDMVPDIKRTAKILLKSRDTNPQNNVLSSRLALKSDIPAQGSELQAWEATEGTWGDEENLDELAAHADFTVRETRRAEREQRHLVAQRRREERDALRETRDQMVAVRLS